MYTNRPSFETAGGAVTAVPSEGPTPYVDSEAPDGAIPTRTYVPDVALASTADSVFCLLFILVFLLRLYDLFLLAIRKVPSPHQHSSNYLYSTYVKVVTTNTLHGKY